jgi:hypothetical protein
MAEQIGSKTFDSCVGARFHVASKLLAQLNEIVARAALEAQRDGMENSSSLAEFFLAGPKDKSFTIKPTMTIKENPEGMVTEIILEAEAHQKK